jgi:type IV pilus assembly protein PilE
MVTVAIVAILASIATASYRSYIVRANRVEAKSELLNIQVAQEKYFLQNNKYGLLSDVGVGGGATTYNTNNGHYKITLPTLTTSTFEAHADAIGSQASDTDCPTYTINQSGTKTPAPSSGCWK